MGSDTSMPSKREQCIPLLKAFRYSTFLHELFGSLSIPTYPILPPSKMTCQLLEAGSIVLSITSRKQNRSWYSTLCL